MPNLSPIHLRIHGLMDHLSLFTTEVPNYSSDTSGEWESDTVEQRGEILIAHTEELKNFGRLPKTLTKEGRERIKTLCTNPNREVRLDQNPSTPTSGAGPIQGQFNTPIQPHTKTPKPEGKLSKLL